MTSEMSIQSLSYIMFLFHDHSELRVGIPKSFAWGHSWGSSPCKLKSLCWTTKLLFSHMNWREVNGLAHPSRMYCVDQILFKSICIPERLGGTGQLACFEMSCVFLPISRAGEQIRQVQYLVRDKNCRTNKANLIRLLMLLFLVNEKKNLRKNQMKRASSRNLKNTQYRGEDQLQ